MDPSSEYVHRALGGEENPREGVLGAVVKEHL